LSSLADEKQFLLKQSTYEQLTVAQEALAAEDYRKSRELLDALVKSVEQGSYDQAVVFQNLAYLYASSDQFSTAIKYFELALNSKALPSDVEHNLLFNLGQLQLAEKKYKQGIANVEKWLKNEQNPNNDSYVLLASAHYQIKQYKQVVNYISKAIKNVKKADESWYQMLLSAHLELKQFNSAIKVLETLITRYPKNTQYWQQLSYLYFQQNKETRAVAVSALVEKLALGDRQTVLNLVDMYRYLHIPYKAASLLKESIEKGVVDKDFKTLESLADSWLAAREVENAVDVLIEMTALDESGETDLKLGRVFVGIEQWQQAIAPLTTSLEKLVPEEQGLPHLLLGTAYFYLNKPEQAEKMFKQTLQYKDYRLQAHQWLTHLAQ
jgi:tetratricopeptide (TPR) repeat protein